MTKEQERQQIETALEHAPTDPGPIAAGLLGWWTPGGWWVCARCAGRIMARGCRLPDGSAPSFEGWKVTPGVCLGCGPAPASAYIPEPAAGYGWRSKAAKPEPTPAGHTPGPWRVGQDGHNILTDSRGDRPTMVASIQHEIGQGVIPTAAEHAEAHANAALIAAAPELLSACKSIVELSQDQGRRNLPECAAIARAAIAKAEGGAV